MSSYSELTAVRIAFHEEQLVNIRRRISSLQERLSLEVQGTSQQPRQEVIDTLRIDIHDLGGQAQSIQTAISDLQRRLDPRIMQSFPDELLSAVFELLCAARSTRLYTGFRYISSYDHARAKTPFILASICRRWRYLALDTARLWTYVGLESNSAISHWRCTSHYFALCFTRSRNEPLDICLDLGRTPDHHWRQLSQVLGFAAHASAQWRTMMCRLPGALIIEHCYPAELHQLFLSETPLLEELFLCIDNTTAAWPWQISLPGYLPHCPHLRAMRTRGCHIVYTAPHAPLNALVHLELRAGLPLAVIWHLLELAPALEYLDLQITSPLSDIWKQGWIAPAPGTVHLDALNCLVVREWAHELFLNWGAALTMPNLRKLVALDLLTIEAIPIAEQCSRSIRSLHWMPPISTMLDESDAEHLGQFTDVQELIIYEHVSPQFIAAAMRANLWPKLQVLRLRHGILDEDTADALLQFLGPRIHDGDSPQGLERATLTDYVIPASRLERLSAFMCDWRESLHTFV
ncbi:hypothetical protein AURDEDRAFT_129377 [Auricularia subglabra TFB-10046 SS5]|nr:hypothetical protein AURDEDRAFT_129377 [Auricularia subglabra TFB-10046 SS5]